MMLNPHLATRSVKSSAGGFTLIEVMISIAILTVALLALAATFASALSATAGAQEDLVAKQKALEAIESIYTARNTQQLGFAAIANINGSGGIFKIGYQPLWAAGADGLVGTNDDVPFAASGSCPGGSEGVPLPGPDGILGTADDTCLSLANFQRQIIITNVLLPDGTPNQNLKQITVNMQYNKPGTRTPRTYTTNAFISSYH